MERGDRRAAMGRLTVAVLLAQGWPMSDAAAQTTAAAAMLAAPCGACHGPGGVSPGAIPSIAGLDAATLAARMREFRTAGPEVTIMNRIARGYTDAEIDLLAQYFAIKR